MSEEPGVLNKLEASLGLYWDGGGQGGETEAYTSQVMTDYGL